jgi:hypothetical protein
MDRPRPRACAQRSGASSRQCDRALRAQGQARRRAAGVRAFWPIERVQRRRVGEGEAGRRPRSGEQWTHSGLSRPPIDALQEAHRTRCSLMSWRVCRVGFAERGLRNQRFTRLDACLDRRFKNRALVSSQHRGLVDRPMAMRASTAQASALASRPLIGLSGRGLDCAVRGSRHGGRKR